LRGWEHTRAFKIELLATFTAFAPNSLLIRS